MTQLVAYFSSGLLGYVFYHGVSIFGYIPRTLARGLFNVHMKIKSFYNTFIVVTLYKYEICCANFVKGGIKVLSSFQYMNHHYTCLFQYGDAFK